MKISKSKQELARTISENGGWRDGAEWATHDYVVAFFSGGKPKYETYDKTWCANGDGGVFIAAILADRKIKGFHNTVLSSAEYFNLYPAPDADGWIEHDGKHEPAISASGITILCKWSDGLEQSHEANMIDWIDDSDVRVIAYRPHKPESAPAPQEPKPAPAPETKPTIEQLAADYRNAKDYAERKQQEADAAKADADARLKALELAGEDIGLLFSPITEKQESELVITDWRDLQAGDVISVSGKWWGPDSEYTVDENDGSRDAPIRVGGYWALIGECSFKFIRRP